MGTLRWLMEVEAQPRLELITTEVTVVALSRVPGWITLGEWT